MEDGSISDELALVDWKKGDMRKCLDQARAQASEIFLFTLKWKDLVNHFDKIETELKRRSQQIELKEKELDTGKVRLEERTKDIELADERLGFLNKKIDELCNELESKKKQLGLMQNSVDECNRQFEKKEQELGEVKKSIEEYSVKIGLKRNELSSVQSLVQGCRTEYEAKEKELNLAKKEHEQVSYETNAERERLHVIQKGIGERTVELGSKEKELQLLREKLAEVYIILSLKEEQLGLVQKSLDDRYMDLEYKGKELDSLTSSITKYNHELALKEKNFQSVNKSIEECDGELHLKKKELARIEKLIEQQTEDLAEKQKHCDSMKQLIGEYDEELEIKEKRHDAMVDSIGKISSELESKKKDLETTEESFQKLSSELLSKEKKLVSLCKQIELKKEDRDSLKEMVKQYRGDLELRKRESNALKTCIQEREQEIEAKKKELDLLHISVEEVINSLKVKKDEVGMIQNSVAGCPEVLELKREGLSLIEKSAKELSLELASKELELESTNRQTSENMRNLEVKEKHCNSLEGLLKEREEELESEMMNFNARMKEFEMREREFDARVKEFGLKETQLDLLRKEVEKREEEINLKEKHMTSFGEDGNPKEPENLSGNNCTRSVLASIQVTNGRTLQMVMNEHLKMHDLVHSRISNTLKTSSDPAQLVLDAMNGFYPSPDREGEMGSDDAHVIRRSCILLLEQLVVILPPIMPHVQSEAMELATQWKAKIGSKAENSEEVLGFLYLLAAFHLASAFNEDELHGFLDIVSHYKTVSSLCKALGLPPRAPESNALASHAKIEKLGSLPVDSRLSSPRENNQLNITAVDNSCHLPPNGRDLVHNEVPAALDLSPDPAKSVLDMIQCTLCQNLKNEGTGFEEGRLKNCVIMLEELLNFPQPIKPHVHDEAAKTAAEWKRKMKPEAQIPLEAVGFLLLLSTYGLAKYCSRNEIVRLFWSICQYKHAPKILQALGFSNDVPCFISNLIQREMYTAAVRFICSFELRDKFHPILLLRKEIEKIKSSAFNKHNSGQKCAAAASFADKREILALRTIQEVIAEYKLEKDLPLQPITELITQLEKQNLDRRDAPSSAAIVNLQQRSGRNANFGSPANPQEPASSMVVPPQPRYVAAHNSTPSYRPIFVPVQLSQSQIHGTSNPRASVAGFQGQLQHHVSAKRARVDLRAHSPQTVQLATRLRPCLYPPPWPYRPSGNGG